MIGQSLNQFRITERLGEGGMGVVYRAEDSHLRREVALKVLPEALVADPDRTARFDREARLLAQLNHPRIAQIHGLEVDGETRALVMELVEGPTLEERMERGALPLEDVLSIGRQIAEALEAAHDKGIVHRDLKPANVKVNADGEVKVLDFGLAKALEPTAADPGSVSHLANSPTLTQGATALGMILGTAAYMSPEQAKGRPVDKRADIWAFGVLLFEMLSGHRLFAGETVTETLAAVLRADPDWEALPPDLPDPLRNLLRRCLERDPRRRLHDVADGRIVLEELAEDGWEPAAPAAKATVAARRPWLGRSVAFALGALVALAALELATPEPPQSVDGPPPVHFRQLTFLGGAEEATALAPDGESFAYVKEIDGQRDVFLQRVGGSNAVNLTAGCALDDREPAFSPEGRRIAYRSECGGGGIFVMGALGESARKVTDDGHDPTWSPDGLELALATEKLGNPFGRGTSSRLWAVRVETGERRLVSEQDAVEPAWSPDGRWIAFWGLFGESSQRDLYLVAADGSRSAVEEAVRVLDEAPVDWSPVWSPDGRSLFFASTRGGTMNLWRIRLDPATGRALGSPTPITAPSSWAGYLSISADGKRLAFVDRNVRSAIRIAPFDPVSGELSGTVESFPIGTVEVHEQIDLAPGGGVLFASSGLPQHLILGGPGGELVRLTEGPHRDRQGTFSPDGAWIFFQSDRWPGSLARIRTDGSGLREVQTGYGGSTWYPILSPNGSWLALSSSSGALRLPLHGPELEPAAPAERLPSPGDDRLFWPLAFSPDGKLLLGNLVSEANTSVGAALLDLESKSFRAINDTLVRDGRFLPDGRRCLLAGEPGLLLVDLESGATSELPIASQGASVQWMDLSPDGRRLAWHERTDESDLWLATFGSSEATP